MKMRGFRILTVTLLTIFLLASLTACGDTWLLRVGDAGTEETEGADSPPDSLIEVTLDETPDLLPDSPEEETPPASSAETPSATGAPENWVDALTESGQLKTVYVSTPKELLEAIAPDTRIILAMGTYDLSTVAWRETPYVTWSLNNAYGNDNKGQPEMVIHDVSHLILQPMLDPNIEELVDFVTPDPFARVLSFDRCDGVRMNSLRMGHAVSIDYECDAAVLAFNDSSDISVAFCRLYGCGAVGLTMYGCRDADFYLTTVTDCSLNGIVLVNSNNISFDSCDFVDNRAYMPVIYLSDAQARFSGCDISGNKGLTESVVKSYLSKAVFTGCRILDNAIDKRNISATPGALIAGGGLTFERCELELGNFAECWSGYSEDGSPLLSGDNVLR